VGIDYAIESTLLGLGSCGLVSPGSLGLWRLGPLELRSPVFLCTAVFWIFITGMASLLRLVGVVAALMRVYAPVALLLLTVTALWVLPGLSVYQVEDAVLVAAAAGPGAAGDSTESAIPLIMGFFALLGLQSVDWGATAARRRDVMLGGLTGIVLAAAWTASMALLVVAGAVGRLRVADRLGEATAAGGPLLSFRWGVVHGIGGSPAGAILILFGLAALAPACYASWIFSRRFSTHWSRIRRFDWTWIGGAVAFVLIATSWASRLESIVHGMGLVFAPAVGAMAGDYARHRGGWAGVRAGLNPAGVAAWAAGLGIPPAVAMATIGNPRLAGWLPPAPLAGFLTAAFIYTLLAGIGLERSSIPLGILEAASPAGEVNAGMVTATAMASRPSAPDRSEPSRAEPWRERQP
jgi:hypothetical protein